MINGSTPVAHDMKFTHAPAPGILPSGIGRKGSALDAINFAPAYIHYVAYRPVA